MSPSLDMSAYLAGSRVFHAESAGERLWVAELTRMTGESPVLQNNLFISSDGRNFHQLEVIDRAGGAVLTDTPGFASALATYAEAGLCLVVADKANPFGGFRYHLKRTNNRMLDGACFFAVETQAKPISSRTRVIGAERYREPDRKILEAQERLVALDRGRKSVKEYRLNRGLKEASNWTSVTGFGRIEEKVEARLRSLPAYRSPAVRILTIGPGQGILERELKERFAHEASIDTFSLIDTISPENWDAFHQVFIGNLDTHRLPDGYDFVISHFGTCYAVDQRRIQGQIMNALNPGGEACFLVTGQMIAGHEPDILDDETIVNLRENFGLIYETVPHPENTLKTGNILESIVIRKTQPFLPAETLLAPSEEMAALSREAWESLLIVANSRGFVVDPKATALDIARFRERWAWKRFRFRHSHERAVQTALFAWPWVVEQGIFVKR